MRLTVGIGLRPSTAAAEIAEGVLPVLPVGEVLTIATIDVRAAEAGLVAFAAERGWALLGFPAAALAAVAVPSPSETVRAALGTPSVAEAAALLAAGPGGRLLVPKHSTRSVTVAVAGR